jgi:Spy/CpxP family protein refolding chaperone
VSKKLFVFLLVILTVVNLSATVTILYERWSNKPPPLGPGPGEPGMMPGRELRQKLDLTQEQIDRIRQSRMKYWETISSDVNEYRTLQENLFNAMTADNPDTTKINQIVDQMGQMQTDIKRKTIHHILGEKDFLSPEQRNMLMRTFIDHMDQEFQRPMFRGMHRPPDHRGKMHRRFNNDDSLIHERNKPNNKPN